MVFNDGEIRRSARSYTNFVIAKLYKTFRFGAQFFIFLLTKLSTFHNINSHKGLTIFECFFHLCEATFDDKTAVFFVDN